MVYDTLLLETLLSHLNVEFDQIDEPTTWFTQRISKKSIEYGVIQGSTLDTLLFLIFVNDFQVFIGQVYTLNVDKALIVLTDISSM